MTAPDLNLLVTLDVLLTEGSVARAAQRLRLSPSAMSRALARLRETTGDPLLVRAGRGLVPTPRALELRETVGPLLQAAQAALRPVEGLDPKRFERTFVLRTREGFVENFGADLIMRLRGEAPGIRLRFVSKMDKDSALLRDGIVDLETGVVGKETGPEVRMRALFQDRFIGVGHARHPLSEGEITPARYVDFEHICVSRKGHERGTVDEVLDGLGLQRKIITIVGSFSAALSLVRASDWVAMVPELYTRNLRDGLFSFALPVAVPDISIALLWHPRMDADPAHRWLRQCVSEVCSAGYRKSQLSSAPR